MAQVQETLADAASDGPAGRGGAPRSSTLSTSYGCEAAAPLERRPDEAPVAIDTALVEHDAGAESVALSTALQRAGELPMKSALLRARAGRSGPLAHRSSR